MLTYVTLLKSLEAYLWATEYSMCPWTDGDVSSEAYLKMAKVTCVTFLQTFLHALFYILCKGWTTTNMNVTRNQATNLTMVMGMIYLVYSAYFLSDYSEMMQIVDFLLAAIYVILFFVNFLSLQKQLAIVQQYLRAVDDQLPESFQASVHLKNFLLKQLIFIIVFFFVTKFIIFMIISYNYTN